MATLGGHLDRRTFLRLGVVGLAGIALGAHPVTRALGAVATTAVVPSSERLRLTMRECLVEMVDEQRVYCWAFDSPQAGLRFPGPVLYATEGATIGLEITNDLPGEHAFAIEGHAASGPIGPGETRIVDLPAPPPGTYAYHDPVQAPLARALGLGGVLVVLPAELTTPYGSRSTAALTNLFADLGATDTFPGEPWRAERTWIWAFNCVDPRSHERVRSDPSMDPDAFLSGYEPRYFTINGKSGYFAAHDPEIAPRGRIGQPALLRTVNLGLATHSPHIHGNHVYQLAIDGTPQHNVIARDTWRMPPLRTSDVLLPFVAPPDAYPWPPGDPTVWTTDLAGDGTTGMAFPMHCHVEMSQTANGGNYPQGMVTHWVIQGDLAAGGSPGQEPPDDGAPDDEPSDDPPQEPGRRGRGRPGEPERPR